MKLTNFEKRLAELEKVHPYRDASDLPGLIDKLISDELAKAPAEQDTALIDEAIAFALELQGIETPTDGAISKKTLNSVYGKNTLKKTKILRPRKWIAVVAAMLVISLLTTTVFALIRHFTRAPSGIDYATVEYNTRYTDEEGKSEFYVTDDVTEFDSIDSFLASGYTESLLYPLGYAEEGISVNRFDTYETVICKFSSDKGQIYMSVNRLTDQFFDDSSSVSVGSHTVYITDLGSGAQGDLIRNGSVYTVTADTEEAVKDFIMTLREVKK
ncbi:MAG: hypothetical protein IJ519_06350 [Clostridia bacterium]|nr:hypothetical protein [Clostridia bacterium]